MYSLISREVYGKFVCDVGCGAGVGTVKLYERANKVLGIDKNQNNINFAKKMFGSLSDLFFECADLAYNEFVYKADVIVCIEVIEHIKNYDNALVHLTNRLDKNGILYITSPNRNNSELGKETPLNKSHVREWTLEEFEEILKVFFNKVELFNYDFSELKSNKETPILAVCSNE